MIYFVNANSLNIPLADKTVQTCVTSPPYYGLRDYGTAKWEGGDAGCDHVERIGGKQAPEGSNTLGRDAGHPNRTSLPTTGHATIKTQYKNLCGKCGARRIDDQIGLESTPELFVEKMVQVFREVRRVLKDDGTLWLNLGDSYAANRGYQVPDNKHVEVGNSRGMRASDYGMKPKDLIGIPWMVAFALRADGWYLRSDIIWAKPNPMPESVTDRPTKSHEYIFLLSKSGKYFYDAEAVREPYTAELGKDRPSYTKENKDRNDNGRMRSDFYNNDGRNKRSVWTVTTKPYSGAHFATFPPDLIEPCILAGSKPGDIVLDPFNGSGTTGLVARTHNRSYVGLELNPAYIELSKERTAEIQPELIGL